MPWSEQSATDDGYYVRAGSVAGIASLHILMLPGDRPGAAHVVVIPLDDHFLLRLQAAGWFWTLFFGDGDTVSDLHPLADHLRQRLIAILRALDAKADGASHRIIGHIVLGAPLLRAIEWKDHSARSQLQRLFIEGNALVDWGYRHFLLPAIGRS
ncbi:DUF2285 domain-containing protein [Mesorhizobium sp. PUT5]|uniref:DUF2285 domain-containing protein n=1 Tax=Mesorhizobium sp. PUT5 TaxID=3454629 RepID=UPI003FA47BC4